MIDFNPRTPCGVRHNRKQNTTVTFHFNPRTPCRVRLVNVGTATHPRWISIHAPLAGCDLWLTHTTDLLTQFQSTHPLRGATRLRA